MAVSMLLWMERGMMPVPVELEPVDKVLGLPASPNELHDCKELMVAAALHQHEEEAKAGLHYHPVHCAQQADVCGQEHNVFPQLNATLWYSRI